MEFDYMMSFVKATITRGEDTLGYRRLFSTFVVILSTYYDKQVTYMLYRLFSELYNNSKYKKRDHLKC